MCTSLARDSIASIRISFTSRMTEASWASSESSPIDVDLVEKLDVLLVLLGHQVVDRLAADAEVGLDLPGDLLALRQHGLDRETGRGAQLVERVEVERVAGGDPQRAVLRARAGTASGGGSASAESRAAATDRSSACSRSTNGMPTSSPSARSAASSLTKPEIDGGHVQPRRVRPVEPKLVELLGATTARVLRGSSLLPLRIR